jgi:hypothetical protein
MVANLSFSFLWKFDTVTCVNKKLLEFNALTKKPAFVDRFRYWLPIFVGMRSNELWHAPKATNFEFLVRNLQY